MTNYFTHMQTKEPHERRRHALLWSAALTGMFAIAWLATLGVRLNSASTPSTDLSAAAANQTQLQVSTTSVYSY